MEKGYIKNREKDLTYVYSIMSPSDLVGEYEAYVKDEDFGIFYKALMKEISSRSKGKPETWINTIRGYQEFVNQSDKLGLNPDNVFEHIPEKGSLLKKIKDYKALKGDLRSIDTLITLKNPRVGEVFRKDYHTAKKHLQLDNLR